MGLLLCEVAIARAAPCDAAVLAIKRQGIRLVAEGYGSPVKHRALPKEVTLLWEQRLEVAKRTK